MAALLIIFILIIISIVPTPISGNYRWLPLIIYPFFGISIFQLLYVIPTIIWLKRRQRWQLMKGVIICAVITALLNGGCWLLVYTSSI
ncbi:MAG TPA: hypothetical protein V6D33_19630 [Cyanophyceae cyanobacterium]